MYKRILSIILVLVMISALFVDATSSLATQEEITLRIHYHRPDGNYEGWHVWAWDSDANYNIYGISDLDGSYIDYPGYKLEADGDDMVCTLTVPAGVRELGYILRLGEWEEKDVDYDQFIDLSGIVSGTVDFYVESKVASQDLASPTPSRDSLCNKLIVYHNRAQHMMVLGSDVVTDHLITHAEYENKQNGHRLIVTLSSTPDYAVTADRFKLVDKNGATINITGIKKSGTTYYLSLDSRLYYSNSYTLSFNNREHSVLVRTEYASKITSAKYDYNAGAPTLSLTFSLAPDYDDLEPSSFYIANDLGHNVQVSNIEGNGTQCKLYLDQPLDETTLYWIYLDPYNFFICDHTSHNIRGYCNRCYTTVDHSYDQNNTCSCGKVLIIEPTPDPDPVTPVEPIIPDDTDPPVDPIVPDETDPPVDPIVPDETDPPADPVAPGDGNSTDVPPEDPNIGNIYNQQAVSPQPTEPQQTPVDNTPKDESRDNSPSINIPLIVALVLLSGAAVAVVIILIKRKKA